MAIEPRYTAFEKAKNYTKQYELDGVDSIVTRQEDDMLGYISAATFATTGSNIFDGGQIILGNLNIDGDIIANNFVTSSTLLFTGSTNHGSHIEDVHTYTGSVRITGSLNVIGGINGVINATNGVVSSSAQITAFGFVSGSYETTGRGILSGSISYNNLTDIPQNIASGSYETTGRGIISSSAQLPNGVISSSAQITSFGFVSGSYETTGRSIISSSAQITAFGFISSSTTIDTGSFAITGSNLFRGDQTITGSFLVSGSTTQIGNNTLIGTTQLSGSIAISGSTEFGGDLFPKEARGATLGTLERPFRDIFLQSASINIASDIPGGRGASISNADGNVTIQAAGFQLKTGSFVPFEISETARIIVRVPNIPAGDIGAFSIIGNASGSYQPVTNDGGLIHLTSNDGVSSRITSDAFGTTAFAAYVGRKARGTATNPLPVQSNDTLTRISAIGWTGPEYGFTMSSSLSTAPTSIDVIALENFTTSSFGTAYRLFNTPIGNTTRVLSAQIDPTGLFVSGAFTSSLSQGHIWVGDSNNRTKIFSTSSFAITGSNVFSGSQGISGSLYVSSSLNITDGFYVNGNKQFNYAQFSDTTTQSGSANTAYSMKFNTTDIATGFSIVSGSRITAVNTGIYNLQFSAQLDNSSNTNELVDIWFAVTGSNVPNSNTQIAINKAQAGNFGKVVPAWNCMLPLSASQYVEIKWSATGNSVILHASGSQSNPTRPTLPSVIATITQIA
jgi:hypothetical protein